MARLGEYVRARELLRSATRAFGTHEAVARSRCIVAEAEVALAQRDLGASPRALKDAAATLDRHGDCANAVHAQLIAARHSLLLGRLDDAAASLALLDAQALPPALRAVAELVMAELAMRSLNTSLARTAFERARAAAELARIPALLAEVNDACAGLDRPAARRLDVGEEHALRLHEVEALLASGALVLDGCRRGLRAGGASLSLARRPILFELAQALAEAWPGDADREALIARAFRVRRSDETHRARLRVEIGRLRKLAAPMATIAATPRGFGLEPREGRSLVVLAPPIAGENAALLALLADGTPWSTSALALALNTSQRSVQRALVELEAAGRVRSIARARAQRWLAPPLASFTTILLLPEALTLA